MHWEYNRAIIVGSVGSRWEKGKSLLTVSPLSYLCLSSANVTQGACKHCSALLLFLEHGPGCYTKSSKVHGLKSWRWVLPQESAASCAIRGVGVRWRGLCVSRTQMPSRCLFCRPSRVFLVWPAKGLLSKLKATWSLHISHYAHILVTSCWPHAAARDSGKWANNYQMGQLTKEKRWNH